MRRTLGPKGILNSDAAECNELLPPRCVVLEEFLAPAELSELLSYTLAHQEHFVVSEVISPGVNSGSTADFEYRRSHVLMDLGPHHEIVMDRLRLALPRVLPKLGIEQFPISRMEAQITASKDGDFFRWHRDNAQDEVAARQLTFVYFFHREPKVFEGGELRIQDSSWQDNANQSGNYYTIIPRQNQLVLFDSSLTHEIALVKCPSAKFADSRFTVNGWFSR
jgi:Rps23 Pro-64 3,4-dihydroxylase Tpa1-like proline 4-hydroxylase